MPSGFRFCFSYKCGKYSSQILDLLLHFLWSDFNICDEGSRKIIILGKKNEKMFFTVSKRIQKAVAINILVYMVIFIINISMGEKVGYPTGGLAFNNILFLLCLIVTTWLLVNVTKGIEAEEKQKPMLHQQELLENYVENLEKM